MGHRITNVPGRSAYFMGSVVAYSNWAKQRILGVSSETLERDGAMSKLAALQMARNVRRLLKADVSIGMTGITGPSGGSVEKLVGLVFIALVDDTGFGVCQEHR